MSICYRFLFILLTVLLASTVFGACSKSSDWSPDAAIDVGEVGATTAVITWPPVENAKEIDGYVIYVGDRPPTKVAATTLLLALEALPSGVEIPVRVEVVREGAAGRSLKTSVRTLDTAPPKWTLGQVIDVKPIPGGDAGLRTLALTWPAAKDNVGVVGYRIVVDGDVVKEVKGDVLATEISIEYAETVLRLVAGDAAENWSPLGILRIVPAQLQLDFGRSIDEPKSLLGSPKSASGATSP